MQKDEELLQKKDKSLTLHSFDIKERQQISFCEA